MKKNLQMKRWLYFRGACILLLILASVQVFASYPENEVQNRDAQQKIITGTVVDGTGMTIPGASIRIKGTNTGVTTDLNGKYRLPVGNDTKTILVFSFLGFETVEVPVLNKTTIDVTMFENSIEINEVVVTALGITREAKSLGYARQSVNVSSMTEARDANLTNMLTGKAAGVNVISGGGSTASTRVEIRGNNSLTGNNQPLYVVDGIIIQNDMGKADGKSVGAEGATDIDYGNIASNINPDDIESIEILKGGNASALYGSDAANGVILITTKKAKKNDNLGVTYSLNFMVNSITEFPDFQNIYGGGNSHRLGETNKYRAMNVANMALLTPYNSRSWGLPMLGFDVVGRNGEVKQYSPNPSNVTDYFRSSTQIVNNLSFSKANDLGYFRFSYSNTTSNDVLIGANERGRHNFSLNSGYNLSKWLSMDVNVRYSIDKLKNRTYSGWSDRNPLMAYIFFPRDLSISELIPWKDSNGNAIKLTNGSVTEYYNPNWALNECWNEDTKNWLLTDLKLNVTINKNLKFRVSAAADIQNSRGFDFTNKGTIGVENGRYSTFSRAIENYQFEGFLMYFKKFSNMSLGANIGANWRDNKMYRATALTSSLILHDVASLSNSAEAVQSAESLETIRRESIFADVTFGYKDLVYLNVTGRNDWNSTLPVNRSSFFYPSASLSVLFSDLLKIQKNILTFGKIRTSWAKVGNGTSFNQLYNNFMYDGIFNNIPIFDLGSRLKNSALKPETTYSTEVGADLRFFDNRLSLDLTLYNTRSVDQIMNPKISTSTGFSEGTFNAGELRNRGVEISVNATPIRKKDFTWDLNLNWSKNRNEVISIMDSLDVFTIATVGSNLKINAEKGEPYGVIRGSRQMRDIDGNIMVNAANGLAFVETDAYLGNVNADFIGSIRSSFRYKSFDFSFMMDFKAGGDIFSQSSLNGVKQGNWLSTLADRDNYTFSYSVLGEDDLERRGINKNEPQRIYTDTDRRMGSKYDGVLYQYYETTKTYTKVGPNNWYLQPQQYWSNISSYLMDWFVYDASYIKLREVTMGYNCPSSYLSKTFIKSARISLVGRNLATLLKNTPRGIDPQATSSMGNAQGLEAGFALPTAYYGFDLKVTF
jgi:TonB-linked SusC/RagA family outer membrane protein